MAFTKPASIVQCTDRLLLANSGDDSQTHESLLRRYGFLFENACSLNLVLLEDGTIVEVNHAGANRLGYDKGDVIGRNVLEFVAPCEASQALEMLHRSFRSDVTPSMAIDVMTPGGARSLLFAPGQHECTHNGAKAILVSAIDITSATPG